MCAVETFVCRIAESSDSTARDLLYSRLELWHHWLAQHQPWFIEGTWHETEEPQLILTYPDSFLQKNNNNITDPT